MQIRTLPLARVRTWRPVGRSTVAARSLGQRLTRPLLTLVLVLAAVIALAPFVWLALTSLKAPEDVFRQPPAWIFTPTFDNYRRVLTDPDLNFVGALTTTTVITLVSTVLSLSIGTLAAYSLARLPLPAKGAYSVLVLWTRMLPPIALVIPLYLVLLRADLLDTRQGLIIVYTAFNTPFVIWILRSFFADVPTELEDAALIDGCSRFGSFVRVILPGRRSRSGDRRAVERLLGMERLSVRVHVRSFGHRYADGAGVSVSGGGRRQVGSPGRDCDACYAARADLHVG